MSQKAPTMPFTDSVEETDDELDPTWGRLFVYIVPGETGGFSLDSQLDSDFTVFERVYLGYKQHIEDTFGTHLNEIEKPAVALEDIAASFIKAMVDANIGFFTSQELYDSLGPISEEFLKHSQALMDISLEELLNKMFNIPSEPKLMIYFKQGNTQINVEFVMPDRDTITQSLMRDERRPTIYGSYAPQ